MSTHKIVVKNTETAFIMANGAKSQIDIGKLYSITLHQRNIGKGTTGSTSAFPKKTLFLFPILPYLKSLVNSGEGISGYTKPLVNATFGCGKKIVVTEFRVK